VGNLGHLFEDVSNNWLSSEIANTDRKYTILLNIQALRDRTVDLGQGRHITNLTHPDSLGFYEPIYTTTLFHSVITPSNEWNNKVVCFQGGLDCTLTIYRQRDFYVG